ncbi:P-loop containing nucleoside triphosphate hydrolase protein, partial [Amylostereum chailletii]
MATRTRGATATRASTRSTRANSQVDDVPAAPTTGTRSTRAAAKTAPARTAVTKASTTRQPLVNKDNISGQKPLAAKKPTTTKATAKSATKPTVVESDREPIKAFLRIRPQLSHEPPSAPPYLEYISDVSVRMVDPSQDSSPQLSPYPRFRPSTTPPTSIYSFSHVFPPATQQTQFFTKTTLPLVKGLLDGENGLLFAYGVTNSGKTYTVQGGSHDGSAGILPRTLDVIFNSIDGLQSNSPYHPVRLQGVELGDSSSPTMRGGSLDNLSEEPVIAEVLAEHLDTPMGETDIDPTILKVDRNHEYSVWLSYAEVYNEKIYDLLADVEDASSGGAGQRRILLTRKALPIRPSPPSDNPDGGISAGKYISGMRQVRAKSAGEARNFLKLGQLHRRV